MANLKIERLKGCNCGECRIEQRKANVELVCLLAAVVVVVTVGMVRGWL